MHFCDVAARTYGRLSKPRKTSLNWFIPALVKSSVGSSPGTTGLDGTTVCPFDAKKLRNVERMSAAFTGELSVAVARRLWAKRREDIGTGPRLSGTSAPGRAGGARSAVVVRRGAAVAGGVARRRQPVGERRRCRR